MQVAGLAAHQATDSDAYTSGTMPWPTVIIVFVFAGFLGAILDQMTQTQYHLWQRQQWDSQRKEHIIERAQWDIDLRNHTLEEEVWGVKRQVLIDEYAFMERGYKAREKDLIQRQEEMKDVYRRTEQEWQLKIGKFEQEWQRKIDAEVRERERAHLYWDDIQGDERCLSNGHKKYTARLANLTPLFDGMEACNATAVTINGVTYNSPISCENRGGLDGIRGHWIAEADECTVYWEYVKKKGCTAPGSGLQRIESKLSVVRAGEDPEHLCLTTPLSIGGQTYDHPMACSNWGVHWFWGIWNIADDKCK
ncbi:hypothetical protein DXG01_004625 [Tephrocybe rancida]|nr:hypothetical protein DXG01_004625 [Tephrocybe rancida]